VYISDPECFTIAMSNCQYFLTKIFIYFYRIYIYVSKCNKQITALRTFLSIVRTVSSCNARKYGNWYGGKCTVFYIAIRICNGSCRKWEGERDLLYGVVDPVTTLSSTHTFYVEIIDKLLLSSQV
jgi:hypothetical protein